MGHAGELGPGSIVVELRGIDAPVVEDDEEDVVLGSLTDDGVVVFETGVIEGRDVIEGNPVELL